MSVWGRGGGWSGCCGRRDPQNRPLQPFRSSPSCTAVSLFSDTTTARVFHDCRRPSRRRECYFKRPRRATWYKTRKRCAFHSLPPHPAALSFPSSGLRAFLLTHICLSYLCPAHNYFNINLSSSDHRSDCDSNRRSTAKFDIAPRLLSERSEQSHHKPHDAHAPPSSPASFDPTQQQWSPS